MTARWIVRSDAGLSAAPAGQGSVKVDPYTELEPGRPRVHQRPGARIAATVAGVVFTAGVLLGDYAKEERLALVVGSILLVAVPWSPPQHWPLVRLAGTTAVGVFLAFAGIVALEAPAATSAWLIGAGLAEQRALLGRQFDAVSYESGD